MGKSHPTSKLQQTERPNGSVVSSINLPKEEIEKLPWGKGTKLKITAEPENNPNHLKIEEDDGQS
jgi:hypothetical protein